MTNRLPLDEIQFGKIDAYNEYQEYGIDLFKNSFYKYDMYKIDDFLNGSKYYICGNKGTGKTALLKYLECELAIDPEKLIIPIRFKSDLDNEEKKALHSASASANVIEETVEDINTYSSNDNVIVWQVFLITKIFDAMNSGEYSVFKHSRELVVLQQLLKAIQVEKSRIVPKINKSLIKFNASLVKGIDAELELEIGFDKVTNKVNYYKFAKTIIRIFESLEFDYNKVFVLVDELELSVKSSKENKRDVELVRDLIIAIEKLNGISKKKGYSICFIASIRGEVINSVLSAGYEINKAIEDFGVTINWFQKGGNYQESPLIKIIESKIIASEKLKGITNHGDIWGKYFSDTINGIEVRKYLLSYSWYRPRDIVRMMREVQTYVGNSVIFSQEMFDKALQDYSEKSWTEFAEELRLAYSSDDLKAIKKILTNIEVPFSFNYLSDRVKKLSEMYDFIGSFYNRHKLIDVLEKLFEWGIIGNSGQRMVFKFMRDGDLAPTESMIIHKPLRNFFAVKSHER
ncbi:hypothetical protein [Paenibacillus sp. FSL R5-0912]|uniref:P-loop ATPase, Sll1717 family n=1 Tax=Paenibacillus sp. FSL R5-0912 TaxID=1536771 RepID=UPI0004F8087E|nr:hypothetical protein [Paenibacillus sp. FSL R5-0912]AIQ40522.1 hypothetical protein R50912_11180 [Paenibacillus sp. FSL R5-0912]